MPTKEMYCNQGASYLTSSITNSATSIAVATSGAYSNFPTTNQFTVRVDSEIMLVTANDGSGNLTVTRAQEGTTAAAHSQGAIIFSVLTDGALRRLFRQTLNGTNQTARREVNWVPGSGISISMADDATNDKVDLTITGGGLGGGFTQPSNTGFSWVNQGTASIATSGSGLYLTAPAQTSNNMRVRVMTAPTAPYTATAYLVPAMLAKAAIAVGLCLRNSTSGKFVRFYFYNNTNQVDKSDSPTVFNSTYQALNIDASAKFNWMRIKDDNTNRIFYLSVDGNNWIQIYSVGRTDFITPDQIGYFVDANNSTTPNIDAGLLLLSWATTTP